MDLSFGNLGANESLKDYRDHKDPSITLGAPYPAVFETKLFDVYHQRKIGQCTDNLAEYVSWLFFKKTGTYVKLSRRFLHVVTKNLIDQNDIEGSSLRATLKAAYNYGICTEVTFPSDVTDETTYKDFIDISKVPAQAWGEALKYKIGGYVSIPPTEDQLKIGLSKYGLLYTRMVLGSEWWTDRDGNPTWDPRFILPLRPPKTIISGHAINHRAYDVVNYTFRNSWSEEWASKGDGFHGNEYMPTEAWAVTLDRIVNDLPPADQFKHNFKTPMERGQRSEEVKKLQIALMIQGDLEYVQPIDRGYFGSLTQEAAYRFQLKYVPMSYMEKYVYRGRYVGAKTLKALNKIYGT